jgi:hypothetical protein
MEANVTRNAVLQGITIQLDAGMTYMDCRFVRCILKIAGNLAAIRFGDLLAAPPNPLI